MSRAALVLLCAACFEKISIRRIQGIAVAFTRAAYLRDAQRRFEDFEG